MSETAETRVFVSYYEDDQLAAEEIARRLRDTHGLQVWLRAWSVVPGRLTQEEQERGLAESDACTVLIGAEGVREWQQLEVYASIARRVEERGSDFPVIPVYLPGRPPGAREAVPAFLELYEAVAFSVLDDQEALRRLACGILGLPPGEEAPVTAMARAVSRFEASTWPATKRIYRFLRNEQFDHQTLFTGLYQIGRRIVEQESSDCLVAAIDPVNFEKPYTHKLEGVGTVYKSRPPDLNGDACLAHGYPAIAATITGARWRAPRRTRTIR